jgi:hypothetical protein
VRRSDATVAKGGGAGQPIATKRMIGGLDDIKGGLDGQRSGSAGFLRPEPWRRGADSADAEAAAAGGGAWRITGAGAGTGAGTGAACWNTGG